MLLIGSQITLTPEDGSPQFKLLLVLAMNKNGYGNLCELIVEERRLVATALMAVHVLPAHIEQLSRILTVISLLQEFNDLLNLDATGYDLDGAMHHPADKQWRQLA